MTGFSTLLQKCLNCGVSNLEKQYPTITVQQFKRHFYFWTVSCVRQNCATFFTLKKQQNIFVWNVVYEPMTTIFILNIASQNFIYQSAFVLFPWNQDLCYYFISLCPLFEYWSLMSTFCNQIFSWGTRFLYIQHNSRIMFSINTPCTALTYLD